MSIPIENCKRLFKFQCPRSWDKLTPTSQEHVRFCNTCRKNVYMCFTTEEIRENENRCIAVYSEDELDIMLGETDEDIDLDEEDSDVR